jgi:tetratricopeptide (TPR) repeat protein
VTKWELADMQARLYLNLGVTKEHVSEFEEAINYYETAIKISKSNDLFELQQQCLMASGLNYTLKQNDNATALRIFNQALEVSKRIHDKNEKTCETLLAMSGALVKNSDFQGAKQMLKKAYKFKSPNQNDKEAIEKMLKVGKVIETFQLYFK